MTLFKQLIKHLIMISTGMLHCSINLLHILLLQTLQINWLQKFKVFSSNKKELLVHT